MLSLLWIHAGVIFLVAMLGGSSISHSLSEASIPAGFALFALAAPDGRRHRATLASLGLVMSSAVLVHLSGGMIEMHFHFFVMVAVITLYQDWLPFLFGIGFVVLHHGIVGVLDPAAVYNHPDALAHPWKWAAIHGGFVLAESVACIASWRLNEGSRALTDQVLNAAGEGIYVLDPEGRTVFGNPASSRMLGLNSDGLVGRPEQTLLSAASSLEGLQPPGHAVLFDGAARRDGNTVFRRADGSEFPVAFVATPLADRGQVTGAVVTFNDITDRLQAEEASRFRLLFASNPHPMWVYDLAMLTFVEVNEAAVEQYGYTRGEFLGMAIGEVILDESFSDGDEERSDVTSSKSHHRRKSGEVFAVAVTSHPIELGGRPCVLVVAQDISERIRFEEQLAHQALHDALTGLPNRALFAERLERALAEMRDGGGGVAVLFLDLDGFKVINDSLGHSIGDEVLVLISRRIAVSLPEMSTLARLGGDEFLVLLDDLSDAPAAALVADSLLAALAPPVVLDGREIFVTASIGIAVATSARLGLRADDLVHEADMAMYQAKAVGKARGVVFHEGMEPPQVERLELESDLRRAVERDELLLHFQPEIDLQTQEVVGMEALVRWRHPQRGLVLPVDFIAVSEDNGLIVPIGKWVLREACRQARSWQGLSPSGRRLVVGVNLSAKQLAQPDLVSDVRAILEETGLSPECLRFEITETAAMQDRLRTVTALSQFRAMGVEIAIDDFGTGYSSLGYLQALPISILKIDQCFVRAFADDPSAQAIVQAIIAVAHTLSMEAVAEGVETIEQLRQLASLGCDRVQGFYFAKALPAAAFEALLRNGENPGMDERAA